MTGKTERLWTMQFVSIIGATFILGLIVAGLNSGIPILYAMDSDGIVAGSMLVTAFLFPSSFSRPFVGRWTDYYGSRKIAYAGIICIVSSSAFMVFTSSFELLFIERAIQGVGFSLMSSALIVIAAKALPKSRVGEGLGLRGLGSAIAIFVGPMISLFLLNFGGSIALYGGFLIMALICAVLLPLNLGKSQLPEGFSGTLTETGVDDASSRRLVEEHDDEIGSENINNRRGRWSESISRIAYRYIEPSALMVAAVEFCRRGTSGIVTSFIVLYSLSVNLSDPGRFLLIATITIVLCRIFAGRLLDLMSPRQLLIPSSIISSLGFLLIFLFPNEITFCLAGALFGINEGMGSPSLYGLCVKICPENRWGVANNSLMFAGDIAPAICVFLTAIAIEWFGYFIMPLCCIIVMTIAVILVPFLPTYKAQQKAEENI